MTPGCPQQRGDEHRRAMPPEGGPGRLIHRIRLCFRSPPQTRRPGVQFRLVVPPLPVHGMPQEHYRGVVRNLSDHDCVCLGLVDTDGRPRRPSYATLNGFVNNSLVPIAASIGDEFEKAVLKTLGVSSFTPDSTPLQATGTTPMPS